MSGREGKPPDHAPVAAPDAAESNPSGGLVESLRERFGAAGAQRLIQRRKTRPPKAESEAEIQAAANRGVSGAAGSLPHLDAIQKSFGKHDVSHVKAHGDQAAAEGAEAMGAEAFASDDRVAFASAPSLHTAAHEAAHVVQQRAGVQLKGGVGEADDEYERHADAVADRVVAGKSAEAELDRLAGRGAGGRGIQRKENTADEKKPDADAKTPDAKKLDEEKPDEKKAEEGKTDEEKKAYEEKLAYEAELVVTSDPAEANEAHLDTFRAQIGGQITSWGLAFDPAAVRLASDPSRAGGGNLVALDWKPEWGSKPATHELGPGTRPVDAKAAQTGIHALAGWSKVKPADQSILDNLMFGETNEVSSSTRDFLRPKFADLKTKSDEEQAKALTGVIGNKDALPALGDEPVEVDPVAVTLAGPTEKKDFEFDGKTADGESWQATYGDGTQIEIIAPKAPEAGFHNHSVQEAADAARFLPKANRALVKQIRLNGIANPADPYWAVQYNMPDFQTYMTAGADGVVTIYPMSAAQNLVGANEMRGSMIHETGHTFSYKNWGDDQTKGKWVDWKTAMDADRVSVSGYAMASIAEDVAETVKAFGSTKGTPKYEEYKKMVPSRFAMLEKEMQ
jgi:hypothetical protein